MINKGKVVGFERTGRFYSKMGLKFLNNQKFSEAASYLKKAIFAEPENCEYYFNLSGIYAEMGNVKESINILEYVVKNLKTFYLFQAMQTCVAKPEIPANCILSIYY